MSPTNTVPAVATMEGKKSVMEEDKYYWKGGRGRGEGGKEGRGGRGGGEEGEGKEGEGEAGRGERRGRRNTAIFSSRRKDFRCTILQLQCVHSTTPMGHWVMAASVGGGGLKVPSPCC